MARRSPHLNWEQLGLIPPVLLTVELSVHLDGQRGTQQFAYRIRETQAETWHAGGVRPETRTLGRFSEIAEYSEEVYGNAVNTLGLF